MREPLQRDMFVRLGLRVAGDAATASKGSIECTFSVYGACGRLGIWELGSWIGEGAEFVPVNSILGTQLWRERDAGGHQPDYQNGSEEESEVRPT